MQTNMVSVRPSRRCRRRFRSPMSLCVSASHPDKFAIKAEYFARHSRVHNRIYVVYVGVCTMLCTCARVQWFAQIRSYVNRNGTSSSARFCRVVQVRRHKHGHDAEFFTVTVFVNVMFSVFVLPPVQP